MNTEKEAGTDAGKVPRKASQYNSMQVKGWRERAKQAVTDVFADKPDASHIKSIQGAWQRAADKHGEEYASDIFPTGKPVTDAGNAPRVKWIICQRHGYLCDWNGTSKGYNWTKFIKAAYVFPSVIAATKACEMIDICAASAVAEMHNL